MIEFSELRFKIARAKGYTFWDSLDKLGPWTRKNNPREAFFAGGIPLYKIDDPDPAKITWYEDDPDWPRDISAAWKLVEEMRDDGWLVIVKTWPDGHVNKFTGDRNTNVVSLVNESNTHIDGYGATAPEAICRAYLSWMEVQGG